MRRTATWTIPGGLAAAMAALGVVLAMLLPGFHGWQIGGGCGAGACEGERVVIDAEVELGACRGHCRHHHHHDDEVAEREAALHERGHDDDGPRHEHDHDSCPVCELIDLMPVSDPMRWSAPAICFDEPVIGRAWVLAAPVFGVLDGRWTPSRGPPRA